MDKILEKLWNEAPLVGLCLFIIYAGYRRWWVWGYQLTAADNAFKEMRAERDEFKAMIWKYGNATKSAVDTASTIADVLKAGQ